MKDLTVSAIKALGLLRERPLSAYKLEQAAPMSPARAKKILGVAAELGIVEPCGLTPKKRPIYRWAAPKACGVCGSEVKG
jgi:hypothetical protein